MAQRSSIKRLPAPLRAEVDRMLAEETTLDTIVEWLAERGETVSRSALGRYKRAFDALTLRMREMREVSQSFVREIGAVPEGQQGRLLVELLQAILYKVAAGHAAEGGETTALELSRFARAVRDLEATATIGTDRLLKVRAEVATEEREKAAKAVEEAVSSQGLTAEQAGFLRAKILGVKVADDG